MAPAGAQRTAGVWAATCAFTIWGLFPLYLAQLRAVSPFELVVHRSLWSLLVVMAALAYTGRWGWLALLRKPSGQWLNLGLAAFLLAANWLLYVWAVSQQRVAEAALGYFITPLINVLLGVAVLHERLRAPQWLAVGLAATGVAWLTVLTGQLPWISLGLAASFGVYGLLRKTSPLGALEGLALETALLMPLALPALVWLSTRPGGGAVGQLWAAGQSATLFWLLMSGPLTALPLVLFASAARRMPLALLGMIQYLGPSIALLVALFILHEPFDPRRLLGFALIWAGLAVLSLHALGRWPAAPAKTAKTAKTA